jgi:ribonuclease E
MAKKMLIDATHPEETRVVVVEGTKLEDFDFESAARKQLIGNIYLAKVTRIEPSLQAAFVDYGGNRHGFLAFNEIHPDYYQIPVADRQALLDADAEEEQRAEDADEDVDFAVEVAEADEADGDDSATGNDGDGDNAGDTGAGLIALEETPEATEGDDPPGSGSRTMLMASGERDSISSGPLEDSGEAEVPSEVHSTLSTPAYARTGEHDVAEGHFAHPEAGEPGSEEAENISSSENHAGENQADENQAGDNGLQAAAPGDQDAPMSTTRRNPRRRNAPRKAKETEARQDGGWDEGSSKPIESVGGEDALDEVSRPRARKRHYKIQEVIKKRQIMLVQILKDERGSKGAALTTYLSIPGRYCVLMPNTARGGGISRKITNAVDRKRLKAVAAELDVPEGMGLIIRTAGANRTKTEIKRDFDYLLRQWETIRELTLRSTAPCLINEEGSIVKRAVRDLYDKDIEIIQVEGEASYREAKDFMRMLMPSHAKKVQPYREPVPLFQRYQVEAQLDSMFDPTVRLKSGGYIVINPTEALVSIDVNSGKATREANIEATALRTNLEAAEEVARQLRLRDLAGLIVIDFIDMENLRNNKAVERKVKDCLAADRANIQIGRISPFGLLEMSRQRLRQGVVETTTRPCANCHGTGLVRSVDSLALRVLRGIEEECQRRQHHILDVHVPSDVAIYILNQKRQWLHQIEARAAASIFIMASDSIQSPNFEIKASDRLAIIPPPLALPLSAPEAVEDDDVEDVTEEAVTERPASEPVEKRDGERRRRRSRDRSEPVQKPSTEGGDAEIVAISTIAGSDASPETGEAKSEEGTEDDIRRRKMRRRRRGRGRGRERGETQTLASADEQDQIEDGASEEFRPTGEVLIIPILSGEDASSEAPPITEMSVPDTGLAEAAYVEAAGEVGVDASDAKPTQVQEEIRELVHEPVQASSEMEIAASAGEKIVGSMPEPAPQQLPESAPGPKRGGWWQRQFGNKT